MKFTSTMRPDRGFATITAIFILVVLGAMGVALVTIFGGQQRSQAYDILGLKAYQSAHAGLDAGISTIINTGACPAAGTFALAGAPNLQDFNVTVACTPTPDISDAGGTLKMFDLTVTACNNATCPNNTGTVDNYVERQLRATVCQGTAC
jgi:MSHA biogenesis protein MshP